MQKRRRKAWDAEGVRRLRRHMELTQEQLAEALGVRQQTISEWETGQYQPRGASERLLSIVADDAGYEYGAPSPRDDSLQRRDAETAQRFAEDPVGSATKRSGRKRTTP